MNRKKITLRQAAVVAFGLAFFLIWLPRALPNQTIVSLLWPVYHWYGVDYYFRFIDAPGVFVGSIMLVLSTILVREYFTNSKMVNKIPIRIHVTGIRGKSTTTRLIGAALRHSGLRVITKTTGKAARLIDEKAVEHRIREHQELPNLREQPRIISRVAANGDVDAIVFECMSIRPKNMIAESKFVKPTISVITNVRADHLDVMGPTLEDVAWTLSGVIPVNASLVTAEKKYLPIIHKRAVERNAKIIAVDERSVSEELLSKFPYMVFKENIAITLAVCGLLGIPPKDAIDGMLEAKPDPGLTRILDAVIAHQNVRFIAAFGVNDVDSTTIVFDDLKRRGLIEGQNLVGLFHARDDRITRTLEFAKVMAKMPFNEIICVGKTTNLFVAQATKEGYPRDNIIDLGPADEEEILRFLETTAKRRSGPIALFGCGNMIGIEGFIHEFENLSNKPEYQVVGAQK
jgi:poly-gamma-glutamate synthase PgsB/CapB